MKLPAGMYYVGDPCYCFTRSWCSILDKSQYFEKPFTLPRRGSAVAFGTAYGDGTYKGTDGNSYDVDSGMIGAVAVKLAEVKFPFGVHKVKFPEPFECHQDGTKIVIGHIIIDTAPEDEED